MISRLYDLNIYVTDFDFVVPPEYKPTMYNDMPYNYQLFVEEAREPYLLPYQVPILFHK